MFGLEGAREEGREEVNIDGKCRIFHSPMRKLGFLCGFASIQWHPDRWKVCVNISGGELHAFEVKDGMRVSVCVRVCVCVYGRRRGYFMCCCGRGVEQDQK